MRKSRFLKELGQEQTYFIYSHPEDKDQSFYLKSLSFPVACANTMELGDDLENILTSVSVSTGLTVTITKVFDAEELKVIFPGDKGFFCYRKFYGRLEDLLLKRLNFELPENVSVCKRKPVIPRKRKKFSAEELERALAEVDDFLD